VLGMETIGDPWSIVLDGYDAAFARLLCSLLVVVEILCRASSTTSTYFVSKRRRYLSILLKLKVCSVCFDCYLIISQFVGGVVCKCNRITFLEVFSYFAF